MSGKALAAVSALLLMSMTAAYGQNQDERPSHLYFGIDVGSSHLGVSGGTIDGVFLNQGLSTVTSMQQNRVGAGLVLGIPVRPHLAVEFGYRHLGNFTYNSVVNAPAADTIQGTYRSNALSVAGIGIVPLPSNWSLFGKLGLAHTVSTLSANSVNGVTLLSNGTESANGLLVGAGISHRFSGDWYLRLGWDHYSAVGGVTTGKGSDSILSLGAGSYF
jgi:opacity protein-like surface antigen